MMLGICFDQHYHWTRSYIYVSWISRWSITWRQSGLHDCHDLMIHCRIHVLSHSSIYFGISGLIPISLHSNFTLASDSKIGKKGQEYVYGTQGYLGKTKHYLRSENKANIVTLLRDIKLYVNRIYTEIKAIIKRVSLCQTVVWTRLPKSMAPNTARLISCKTWNCPVKYSSSEYKSDINI